MKHSKMDFFDNPYYRNSKTTARLTGQWPYQNRWESRVNTFIIIFLCTTQYMAGILGAIYYSDDKEIIIESISPFMIDAVGAIKYSNCILNVRKMVKLLDRLKDDWNEYTMEEDKRILHEYAHTGQLIVSGYIVAIYGTVVVFCCEPLLPNWISIITRKNETVACKYPVPIHWYIVDMEKHFYPIWIYESICIAAILTLLVANDTLFIVFLQHACAIFAVVGRQFENLPSNEFLEKDWNFNKKYRKTDDIQYDYYVMCIKNHKRALEFAKLLEDMYVWSFAGIIAINMPIMSVTAVQLATPTNTIQQTIKFIMFGFTQMMHLFFDCFLSQRLRDYSVAIQEHITFSQWYGMSLKTQKLITLTTMRTRVPCQLTAGKIVLLSMETFGVIIKTSASYFTVMVSMR